MEVEYERKRDIGSKLPYAVVRMLASAIELDEIELAKRLDEEHCSLEEDEFEGFRNGDFNRLVRLLRVRQSESDGSNDKGLDYSPPSAGIDRRLVRQPRRGMLVSRMMVRVSVVVGLRL